MKQRLQQPAKQRYRYNPNLTRPFARHLGRRLSARERAIITFLERARISSGGHLRAQVIDTTETADSKDLLIQYLQYLKGVPISRLTHRVQRNQRPLAIVAKTKTAVTAEGAHIVPFRRPDNLRGHDITHALVLDAHTHRRINETLRALLGTLPLTNTSGTACIIHSRRAIPLPRAYLPIDDSAPPPPVIEDLSATAGVILIDLSPHEAPPQPSPPPLHPQKDEKEKRRITRLLSPHIRPLSSPRQQRVH